MTEKGFIPLTSELGVPGTSYRIQLGDINEKWAVRLIKGRDVIDSYVFKDMWWRDLTHVKLVPEIQFYAGYQYFQLNYALDYILKDGKFNANGYFYYLVRLLYRQVEKYCDGHIIDYIVVGI